MDSVRETLGLQSHPEGGAFRELMKSPHPVDALDGRGQRAAMTHIYFHLEKGEVSRFHRVESDEIWHLYEGEGMILYQWSEGSDRVEKIILGQGESRHCHRIPAGVWQAAEPIGDSTLVGCTVAPGFEFADFTLVETEGEEAEAIRAIDPRLEKFF